MVMEASSTWQATFRQGEKQGEKKGEKKGVVKGERKTFQKMLLLLGSQKFGKPSDSIAKALKGTSDLKILEAMAAKILSASDWDDLIAR